MATEWNDPPFVDLRGFLEALRRNNNNRARAAAELGVCRMTLYKKLHRYGLMEGERRTGEGA